MMNLPTLPGMPDIGGLAKQIGGGLQAIYGQTCAIAGYLKPATVPNVKAGTTVSGAARAFASSDVIVVPFQTKRIDVTLFDNGAFVKTAGNVEGNYDTEFELIGPGFYSFPIAARRIALARSGGAEARYSVVAWT